MSNSVSSHLGNGTAFDQVIRKIKILCKNLWNQFVVRKIRTIWEILKAIATSWYIAKKKLLENKNHETLLCCHWVDPFSVKLFLVLLFNKGTNLTHYLVKPSPSFSPVVINLNFLIDFLQFLRLQKPFRNHLGNYFRETLSARFILNQKPWLL